MPASIIQVLPDGNTPSSLPGLIRAGNTVANAAVTPGLTAVQGKTLYLTMIVITGTGATAATTVLAAITGLLGGTINIPIGVSADVNASIAPIIIPFNPPMPASNVGVGIAANMPAFGAGNLNASLQLFGFAAAPAV
jgi:hypothetical protein